jgi:hypothetical protein
VGLLDPKPYPATLRPHEPLATALGSLRSRLVKTLALYGRGIDDLVGAELTFVFPALPRDHSLFSVHARLTAPTGRRYERTVGVTE